MRETLKELKKYLQIDDIVNKTPFQRYKEKTDGAM